MASVKIINLENNIDIDVTGILGGKPSTGDRVIIDGTTFTVSKLEFIIKTGYDEEITCDYKVWVV